MNALRTSASKAEVRLEHKVHEDLVSEVARLRESFAHVQTALDQSATERKQLREILDQVQRAREQSSTELAKLREQMNRLGSIDSVDKRLQQVEYNLPRLDGQVELLTKMTLAGTTSHPQAQAPSVHERRIMIWLKQANV
uniref:Uncharacterized protein n=1 Tax=Hyaloperonospora arabidopsidis (strain Emoy2) TaxID=559515 RepID=M4BTT9_HYAAE